MDTAKPGAGLPLFDWEPPQRVIPFPLARRREFVWRQAVNMARMAPDKADAYLARQLDQQRAVMARRGIAASRIDRELARASAAIQVTVAALCEQGGAA